MHNPTINIDRAIFELKSGRAVSINKSLSILASETAVIAPNNPLVITGYRAKYILNLEEECDYVIFSLKEDNQWLSQDIFNLTTSPERLQKDLLTKIDITQSSGDALLMAAIRICYLGEIFPSFFISSEQVEYNITTEDIESYQAQLGAAGLYRAAEAPLTLLHATDSQIICYRANFGTKEHYAIIIGNPSATPLVRLHSSCYTGDLLASLACDCRDQLHLAIQQINNDGGGIILYLMQEGRGIGLVNKIRTYGLQADGFDTAEANEIIGYPPDYRNFLPAKMMLEDLGIEQIRLLTNNSQKAQGLANLGIDVVACVSCITEENEYNKKYLSTKMNKMKHFKNAK